MGKMRIVLNLMLVVIFSWNTPCAIGMKEAFETSEQEEISLNGNQFEEDNELENRARHGGFFAAPISEMYMYKDRLLSFLTPNKFLELALWSSIEVYDPQTGKWRVDQELVRKQSELIEASIERGADGWGLFHVSLSVLYANQDVLLELLTADHFLELALQGHIEIYTLRAGKTRINEELARQQSELIEVSMKRGADGSSVDRVSLSVLYANKDVLLELLTADQILKLALQEEIESYDSETEKTEVDEELARKQLELMEASIERGADGSSVNRVSLSVLYANRDILLNLLAADQFLELTLECGIKSYDYETRKDRVDKKLVQQQMELIEASIKEGADGSSVDPASLSVLYANRDILLNLLAADQFLKLTLESYIKLYDFETRKCRIDEELVWQQWELIEASIEGGADGSSVDRVSLSVLYANRDILLNLLTADQFLKLTLQGDIEACDFEIKNRGIYEELVRQQSELIKASIERGADNRVLYPSKDVLLDLFNGRKNGSKFWEQKLF